MTAPESFEALVAEGADVPVDGWDFSWFEGRALVQAPRGSSPTHRLAVVHFLRFLIETGEAS